MAPLNNFIQDEEAGSFQDAVSAIPTPKSYEEAKTALQGNVEEDSTWGRFTESYALQSLEQLSSKRLSVQEANAKYPDMKSPFREPVAPAVADFLHDRDLEKQKRDEVLRNGPMDTWSKVKLGGVALRQGLMDPIDNIAMLAGGELVKGASAMGMLGETLAGSSKAAGLARAARAGEVSSATARAAELGFGGHFIHDSAIAAGAGVSMATVQELTKADLAGRSHQDGYDSEAGLKNIGEQLALAPVFGAFGAFLQSRGSSKIPINELEKADIQARVLSRAMSEMSPEAKVAMMKDAIGSVAEMREPNTAKFLKGISQETSVASRDFPDKFNYQFSPLGDLVPAGKKLYVAASPGEFEKAAHYFPSDAMGDLTHATDHPGVANATAARQGGHVWEITPKSDLKAFDLGIRFAENQSMSKEAQVFEHALEKAGVKDAARALTDGSAKDAIDFLHESGNKEAMDLLSSGMKDLGYDVLTHDGSMRNGVQHEPHNAMMFLDDSKIQKNLRMTPDESVMRIPPMEEQLKGLDFTDTTPRGLDYGREDIQRMYEQAATVHVDSQKWVKELADTNAQDLENFKMLEQQGELGPAEKKLFKEIQEMDASAEDRRTAIKALMTCMAGMV